jgi:sugar lactone lactonase YvrE
MAGFHQLWALDLVENRIVPYAGDGGEDIVDGQRLQARCAQPYGIQTDGALLYFADSETSSVRTVGFGPDAEVRTLFGRGLFEFGDIDGPGSKALFQHCQGVALRTENGATVAYVADTYNHRIKRLTTGPGEPTVATFAGTGTAGSDDGPAAQATFDEPAGLAVLGDSLYVADTDNHAIRVIDLLKVGHPVGTLDIRP